MWHRALELADQHPTPFYVYDLEVLLARAQRARAAMPASLYFAVKANPNETLLRALQGEVAGLDVASVGELELALRCGWRADQLSFAGPGKTDEALRRAVEVGASISVESVRELQFLAALGARPRVRVRVNPRLELKAWRVAFAGTPSPFGIDEEALDEVRPLLAQVDFQGVHVHAGSQCTSVGGLAAVFAATLDLAERLPGVRSVNFGGGWGVVEGAELDVEAAGAKLGSMLRKFGAVEAVVEPGRWLAAPAGLYVTRVVSEKVSRGTHFVVLDGGLHQHLGATGHLGGARLPVVNLSRSEGPRVRRTLAGPLCTPLDTFGEVELVEPRVGDVLAVENSGAYGPTFSPLRFLGHPPPAEYVLSRG